MKYGWIQVSWKENRRWLKEGQWRLRRRAKSIVSRSLYRLFQRFGHWMQKVCLTVFTVFAPLRALLCVMQYTQLQHGMKTKNMMWKCIVLISIIIRHAQSLLPCLKPVVWEWKISMMIEAQDVSYRNTGMFNVVQVLSRLKYYSIQLQYGMKTNKW